MQRCTKCGVLKPESESFHVDHLGDVVRGILCVRCNNALGQLKEDAELAYRAAHYLEVEGFVGGDVYELEGRARARALGLRAA